jgi:hypothetical protein
MQVKEALLQYPAFQKRSKFLFNEPRQRTVPFLLPDEECLQVLRNHTIEKRGFRTAGTIRRRWKRST